MPTITDEMVDTLNQRLANAGNPLQITKGSGRNIDYDSRLVIEKPNPTLAPLLVDQYEYINCSNSTQQVKGSISKSVEAKYSWHIKAGLKIGASVTAEAGVIFASAKTTASVEVSLEGGKEESTTETIEISSEFPVSVPTMTKTRLQAIVQQEKVENLPFTANVILNQGVFKASPANALPLYRYYNSNNGDHFYTTNFNELGGGGGEWNAEGVTGYIHTSPQADTNPLHRYYNHSNNDHFYTTNFDELGGGGGDWNYEGVQGHIFPTQKPNTVALHRYFNSGNGDHFYTTNFGELGGGGGDWNYEGVTGFIFPDGIDLDIVSALPIEARTFFIQGTFKGQSISRSTDVFISEKPMTKKACDILAGGSGAQARAGGGSKTKPKKPFYVNKTPDEALPAADLILNKRGVKKVKVKSK